MRVRYEISPPKIQLSTNKIEGNLGVRDICKCLKSHKKFIEAMQLMDSQHRKLCRVTVY